jgi:hypothetical protein
MTKCPLCDVGHRPDKMRRQWIHHFPQIGRLIVCEAMALKPQS